MTGTAGPPAPRVGVAIPAAGAGRRMGGRRKPWLELLGEPLLLHTLRPFLADRRVVAVRVALAPGDAGDPPEWLVLCDPRVEVVAGGGTRAASVRAAVEALPADVEVILVHDAARPLVDRAVIDRCVEAARAGRSVVAAWPAVDTLKEVGGGGVVVGTLDRDRVWHAQTPQAFPAGRLRDAYAELPDDAPVTDDAAVVERAGGRIHVVEGSSRNLKVTRPDDVAVAELFLRRGGEPEG